MKIVEEKRKLMEEMRYEMLSAGYKVCKNKPWVVYRDDKYAHYTCYLDLETLDEWIENWEMGKTNKEVENERI